MSFLESLNNQQKEAVTCVDHHLRIIAGAGSGKTRVVTTRIAYLINECHVYPNKILAITFTNKAAREMKERVASMLQDVAKAVSISTIHSFCVRLLREDILELGYPRDFTIFDSDDQKSILKEAYKKMHIDTKEFSYSSMLSYISNNKTNHIDAAMAKASASQWTNDVLRADVYEYYETRLKEMYALDFDDLLIFAYRILKGKEDVRNKWQRRFKYIHVDEFQDVDELQYSIIRLLVKDDSFLCVVGDPDQTIYTWRGASVDIIMKFDKDFPDSKTVILNENYRSTQPILDAANALICHNRNRIEKELFTRIKSDERVVHFTAMDDSNEPLWVASRIMLLHHQKTKYHDIAVLYRSNYLSRGLEKAMLDFHIPYRIYGGIRFYDRAEIKDAISYLRLLAPKSESDSKELYKNLALQRIINLPKRGIGAKTLEMIEQQAEAEGINMYEALCRYPIGKGKARQNLQSFIEMIERYRAQAEFTDIDTLLENLLEESGYLNMLRENKEEDRLENIKELWKDLRDYKEQHPEGTLQEYLQEISLYTDRDEENDADFVQLMTVHAAKGLEFDHVFVYSLCEGVFPNEKSIAEGGRQALEEERRLAYVAFTRAKKRLYLSDSYGFSYILQKVKTTSRFVKEIPEEYLEEAGAKVQNRFSSDIDTYSGNDFLSMRAKPSSTKHSDDMVYNENTGTKEKKVKKRKRCKLDKGDHVIHDTFGEGMIISVQDGLATIAFDVRYGIKKIMVDHPSLHKQ